MTEEQKAKNIRVATELCGLSLGAETDSEIHTVLNKWVISLSDEAIKKLPSCTFTRLWKGREGEWYQAELEAYVANWRKEPPDFCNDWNLVYQMEDTLIEMAIFPYYLKMMPSVQSNPVRVWWSYRHPESPEYCVDAALSALDSIQPAPIKDSTRAAINDALQEVPVNWDEVAI